MIMVIMDKECREYHHGSNKTNGSYSLPNDCNISSFSNSTWKSNLNETEKELLDFVNAKLVEKFHGAIDVADHGGVGMQRLQPAQIGGGERIGQRAGRLQRSGHSHGRRQRVWHHAL